MDASKILNDVTSFEERQLNRCADVGIDARAFPLSHIAYRCRTWSEYRQTRDVLESLAAANVENIWNGRPISKLLLAETIAVSHGRAVELVELIAPFHQRVYRMGFEHVGYVVGPDQFDHFVVQHRAALTGQQFQSSACRPVYRFFDDYTHVKFYEHSLRRVCEREGAAFEGVQHAEWEPADPAAGPYEVS